MIWKLVAIAIFCAALAGGGFLYGAKVESENWIAVVTNLEGELNDLKASGDDRAKRADDAAKKATAELATVRKQAEADRNVQSAEIRIAWSSYMDERVRAAAGASDVEPSLAACRADAAAARGALDRVLEAAIGIRHVAVLNTEQLRQLQQWVTEASK